MSITTCSRCGHAAPPDAAQCPKCGTTLGSRPRALGSTRFQAGDFIDGRYEVIERLPGGGMGELYKVRHIHLGEYRVVKILRGDQLSDETQRKRFFQEARIAASIKHPNVGLLHDFAALPDGTFYMAQEFIDGVTISRSIRGGRRFSLAEIVDITRQVLLGLVAIHDKEIIHRDISPDNLILCQSDGAIQVRIIDLGIAKSFVAGEGQALTSAGLFIGKPHYASPEQMRMIETEETIDHRSDIYSLGVVIYEMIVGKVPFEAATPLAYLLKQVSEEIRTVNRDVSGVVPPELDAFIVRMLKTKRDERFATARDALRALDEVIACIPQLLYRHEIGSTSTEESFPRTMPRPRKEGTDEIPFDQLAVIIQRDRTEPGREPVPLPLANTDDDDVQATEVQSLEGLMTTTAPHERPRPRFDTVEAPTPPAQPDRTMPSTTTPTSTESRPRRSGAITIAVVSLAFLAVVSVGGWLFYRLLDSRLGGSAAQENETTTAPTATTPPAIAAPPPPSTSPATSATLPVPAAAGPATSTAGPVTATAAQAPVEPPRPRTPPRTTPRPAQPVPQPAPVETIAVATVTETVAPPAETVPPPVREGDIVAPGEGVIDAQLVRKVEPLTPPGYAVMGNRGFAMFSVLVDIDGSVQSVRLIRSSGSAAFDELASSAAKKSAFSPATRGGVRVKMWRTLRFDVKVRGTM